MLEAVIEAAAGEVERLVSNLTSSRAADTHSRRTHTTLKKKKRLYKCFLRKIQHRLKHVDITGVHL